MLPALIGALLVGSLSGMGAAFVTLKFTGGATGDPLILATIARSSGATAEMVFLFLGLLMCLAALDWTLTRGQRLVIDAMQEGFFPRLIGLNSSRLSIATGPLLMITLLTTLALVFIPFNYLANVTALVYFVFFSILIIPDILPGNITLPGDRPLKLPFHPLIPALAVVISIYFSLALGVNPWLMLGVWALTGGFFYLFYARQAAIDTRKHEHVIADLEHIEKDYRILVEVTGRGQLATLLQVGQKLAHARDGQLLVLRVVVQPEQIPVDRWLTGQAYKSLKSQVQELTGENAPVDTIVRVAPTRSEGILETVREEGIDLVIVNWSTVTVGNETRLDPEIDEVVQHAPCDVGVLRGKLPDQLENITVSTAGGPHASQALQYGVALSAAGDGNVTALNIVLGEFNSDKESQAAERLHKAVLETGAQDKFSERIAPAQDIREGIVSESSDADLLLMGASTRGMLDAAVFAGIPFSVAQSRPKATLLIKHYEGARQFWLRQAWEYVYKPFPNLTVSERAEVTGSIQDSAIAGVDYYVMITLSSVIAVLGLITNSAAVIIGAMLVAPLMSPILVMAHSIVLGDVRVMTKGAESTLKGIVAAIVVSAGIALIIPTQPLTSELLARTQPNLFDLVVALASGAAAAYAISRKHLAAALPGVAIAAALVPPLTVVGIGLGYSMYSVAGGAMLLFITNLSAIVLSAAIVFLVLGFRPTMAERGQYMQRWILASIAILLVIAIPLGVASVNLGTRLDRQQAVQEVLEEIISRELAEIEDVTIEPQGSGYLVVGTVYTYGEITTEEIEIIQAQLSQAVGAPVSLRLRIVPARLEEVRP
jgi:uncharacterized hydrophobic protein (TIGR00271 family)